MSAKGKPVVLITGASSGIGRACASHLSQKGYQVYGTSRRVEEGTPHTSFELIPMDVTSDASVERAVETVLAREERLDVVVNNAGISLVGPLEETSLEEAQAQLETNFFGVLRVCRAVLPVMRKQRSGYIVNVSSIAGLIGVPFQSAYSASKFALEGLTEALRIEVQPYGIRAVLIEPGDIHTEITAHRHRAQAAQEGSAYEERYRRSVAVMESDETNGPAPMIVAHLLEQIIVTPSPRLRYPVGPIFEKLAIALKRAVPYSFFEWVLTKYYRLG
jgi:NAD(P)-dependent dehydrogenase (short-subunit alcohol dehydrogenase family)